MANLYYLRVSTVAQSTDRQFADIELPADCTYQDKISGSKKERPALDQMIKALRKGDTVNVWSIDRAARNLQHLLELIETINSKGASVKFHKESMEFSGNKNNAMAKMQLQVLGACAEFQRALINEAAAEGRAVAKAKGVKFGRKPSISPDTIAQIKTAKESGKSVTALAIDFDISRQSVYRALAA